jgi:hypothetical protein
MGTSKVQLTIHGPGRETEVPDDELPNLRAQGLIRAGGDGQELVTAVKATGASAAGPATTAAKPAGKE